MARTWWVNNGDLLQFAIDKNRGVHWVPVHASNGSRQVSWDALRRVRGDDVLVHYGKGLIRSIGRATADPERMVRPADQRAQDYPVSNGSGVRFEYWNLDEPIALDELPAELVGRADPFSRKGKPKFGYFFPLGDVDARALRTVFSDRWPDGSPWASAAIEVDRTESAPTEPMALAEWMVERESNASRLNAALLSARAAEADPTPARVEVVGSQFVRDPYVAAEAKRLANGKCDLCGEDAPFMNAQAQPYLESHHVEWLSRGGADAVTNVSALCPNCHRRMHVLDRDVDRQVLVARIESRAAAKS